MNNLRAMRLRLTAGLGTMLALQGCQGLYLHQPDRAAVAATAKTQLNTVDIDALSRAERENIARMTAEEIKAVDAREKSVAQLAAIQLSSDDTGIDRHYGRAIGKVQLTLGTLSMLELKAAGDCKLVRNNALSQVLLLEKQLRLFGITKAPTCAANMPPLAPPLELPEAMHPALTSTYALYTTQCASTAESCKFFDKDAELANAEIATARRKADAQAAREALAQAHHTHSAPAAANKAATDKADSREADLRGKAQKLVDALDKLAQAAPGEADRIKTGALMELLSAAASGTTAAGETSMAADIAKSLPSLAQSFAQAQAAAAQVPVSHLLLALNNQVILTERNDRLAALDQEELTALRQKVQAREKQAELWRKYSDNLCKLALLVGNQKDPGGACETITFTPATDKVPAKCTLRSEKKDAAAIHVSDCVLAKSWRELFKQPPGSAIARRHLHEAAAAYLQVRLTAYDTTQEELRRIDVLHRRTIVQREASLQQWKNLVAVPASELDAYYAGGAKPAEIADLLVKSLGLTAIAVGASK